MLVVLFVNHISQLKHLRVRAGNDFSQLTVARIPKQIRKPVKIRFAIAGDAS